MSRWPTDEKFDGVPPEPKKRTFWQKIKRLIGSDGFMAIAVGILAAAIVLYLVGVLPLWAFLTSGAIAISLIWFGGRA